MQAVVDLTDVEADRIDAHAEIVGAAFVAVAFGEELENSQLPRRKVGRLISGKRHLAKRDHSLAGDFRRHWRTAGMKLAYAIERARRLSLLEQIAARARTDRGEN